MIGTGVDGVVEQLGSLFEGAGVEAYLVGGFVRDRLLGRTSKDIDIVCIHSDGVDVLRQFARDRGWSPPQVFERFGTAQTRGEGFIVETVRARKERYDPESRKPEVSAGTLDDDIMRRDFTVNALCQTFEGDIIDLTGHGRDDLTSCILRTPLDPHETFSEDPLRMFRAARFVAQLGFSMADGLLDAMRVMAPRASVLSSERIHDEMARLLISPHPRDGMNVLRDGALLEVVAPELLAMVGIEQGGYHLYDVWDHTMHALEASPDDLITRLAVLFHDIGKPPTHVVADDGKHTFYGHPATGALMARNIMTHLKFSNDEIDAVAKLVELHLRPIQYDKDEWSDSAVRRLIRDAGDERNRMLDVARADTVASSYPTTSELDELARRMDELDHDEAVSHFVAPLSGDDIMALAQRPPGRWVGAVKQALEDAVIDGELPAGDTDAARAWLIARPDLWQTGENGAS